MKKILAAMLVTTTLVSGAALAQTATKTESRADAKTAMQKAGDWRASKLSGVDVYNERNEKIGDIRDRKSVV